MKTAWRLLVFLRSFIGWVALSVLLSVATIASAIGLLGTSAYLIARAALHPSISVLEVAIVGVRFFGISRGVFRYLERLVTHAVNFRVLGNIQVWFYQKLEPLAPARFQSVHSGDLLSRSIADIETLQDFYVRAVAPPLTALVVTIGMSLFVGQAHPTLTSVLLGGLLVSGVGVPWLSGAVSRGPAKELVTQRARLSQALVDGLQGMPDLLAFDAEEAALEQFNGANRAEARGQRQLIWTGAMVSGINLLVVNCTLAGVLLIAIPLVSAGLIDGVMLAVLALVTLSSFEATTSLGAAAQHIQSGLQAAQRLFDVADQAPAIKEPAQPLTTPASTSLSFRQVSFTYPGELTPALQSASFDLPVGKRIGILGSSGAGKSSLLNLVLRFWEYDGGQILLSGQDIRRYASNDVRQKLAVISQDTYMFSTTLRENLRLANPQASEADMLRALEMTRLMPWLQNLPRGLDTWIGEHGLLMSGGERQRLAAARAILRDASLFLLDEPASHLDAETESELVRTLLDITRGKSVLWVSHSLQGMAEMDEILIMRDGRIVERGAPSELLVTQGEYTRLAGTNTRKPSS